MTPCDYGAIREAAGHLAQLGLSLQTVIPVELPTELYPKSRKNQATGEWEPVLKNGALQPAITGKNPSFWRADGKPQLISHARLVQPKVLLERIAIAERLGKELGLAIIPSKDVVSIDFDTKNYDSVQHLEADWMALLDRFPVLTGTRMERTPSGGLHIYVRVTDRMASWQRPGGGLYCQFTTKQGDDDPHRGEVLAGTRVSVCAPTRNGKGPYELINPEAAYCFVEVPDLASIGIYPKVKAAPEPAAPQQSLPSPPASARQAATGESTIPQLADLIGSKAQEVLRGGRPYGGDGSAAADRSLQLTGFVKELWSWHNLLLEQGWRFEGDPDQLLAQAIAALDIGDKAERVLASIIRADCRHRDPNRAQRHYAWLAGNRSHHWGGRGDGYSTNSSARDGDVSDPKKPPPLSREECRDRLRDAVAAHRSPTELELLLGKLVDESQLHPQELRQLLAAVRLEDEQRDVLRQEASALEENLARQQARAPITLDRLFPPPLAEAIRRITEHLPYCDHVVATAYLAGVSGLVKLGTSICGNPYTDFVTPANLYVATVGRSGQKKTPLEKLLVRRPAQELKQEMAAANTRAMESWREQCKSCKNKDERPPKPVAIYLQIQDYTGEAFVQQLQELDKRGLSVLVLRDELSGLFGAMNAYRSGRGSDEQQLLELFDGQAYTSLRVSAGDRSYERCQVSIYGAIQPGVLRELIKGGDPSGKWARFLFSPLPENTVPLPTAVSAEGVAAVNRANEDLQAYARRIYTMPPQRYQLDLDAIVAFSAYEHDKQIQAQQARLDAQGALYGKSAGKVLRVAVLLHLLELAVLNEPGAVEVPVATLQRAIELVDAMDDWALGFHEQAAAVEEEGGVSSLMRRIHTLARNAKGAASWTQLRQQMSGREKRGINAALADQAMRALDQLGVGKVCKGPRGGLLYRATADLPM
ncbi:hypothetical protein SynRS9909_00315 [Synechococcus sp. RS9909]|uniref:DUF3987 domain-containing protein n=1 Tax=unclassified Synechococcus TaxID=2626047 RepID=UPI00006907AD|nr:MULTISPECIES: DUF3987 domain-containing protein [unclassified Synechococcus]EAQ70017.1 possible Signal peptidase I [Synechococcus sp. RS9917]QNI78329.1 hypothetical protein SynRS9909_00315 [Synechococcus sp. RS9909]